MNASRHELQLERLVVEIALSVRLFNPFCRNVADRDKEFRALGGVGEPFRRLIYLPLCQHSRYVWPPVNNPQHQTALPLQERSGAASKHRMAVNKTAEISKT